MLSRRKKVFFGLVTVVSFAAAVEVICRVVEPRLAVEPAADATAHAAKYLYPPGEYHPFTIDYNQPNVRLGNLTTNSLGFRGTREVPARKAPNARRVFVLGGSTAVGFGASSDETTIPAQLEQILRADHPGLDIEVYNAGSTGFNSSQELILLNLTILELEPDLVVVLDGINDLYYASLPRWRPHYTYHEDPVVAAMSRRGPARLAHDALGMVVRRSAAIRVLTGLFPSRGPRRRAILRPEAARLYARNVERMAHLCAGVEVPLLAVLQPSLAVSTKTITAAERRALDRTEASNYFGEGYLAVQHAYYPLARAALADLRLPPGAFAIDGSDLFAGSSEEIFTDVAHFNDRGNRLAAEFLAACIREHRLLDRPSSSGRNGEVVSSARGD
jgi:lysophospholipase L1-like esterase